MNQIKTNTRLKLLLAVSFLISITTIAFLPVLDNGFVNWDDYVSKNNHVQSGLTLEGILWAFTTFMWSNWHPLTWLSYMFDIGVYQQNPAGHHFSNLVLHVANTLLLFFALQRMTGSFLRSVMVAAIFAVHPLHVEPVAWIAGRKDVLSTFFGLLAIIAYTRYVKRPGLWIYVLVLVLLALGLMSKSMLVTLPFVLLLLDYWPLQRIHKEGHSWRYLIKEKVPLFVLSVLFSIVIFLAQKQGGATAPYNEWDITSRLANTFVSYTKYMIKVFVPQDLSAFYPLAKTLPIWQIVGSILLVGVISIAAIRIVHRAPYILVGWLWYLGTLFPVIGMVQSGSQSMADRFTYIPLIGLFMAIIWGLSTLFQGLKYRNIVLAGLAIIVLSNFTIAARKQTGYWKDTLTLFSHAADVTEENWLAQTKVGHELLEQQRFYEAIYHYEEALRFMPEYKYAVNGLTNTLNNLGFSLLKQGLYEDSIKILRKALQINSDKAYTYNYIGFSLFRLGRDKEALGYFEESVRIDPDYSEARKNLAEIRKKLAKTTPQLKKGG